MLVLERGVTEGCIRTDISVETLAILLQGLMRTRAYESDKQPDGQQAVIEIPVIIDLFLKGATKGAE